MWYHRCMGILGGIAVVTGTAFAGAAAVAGFSLKGAVTRDAAMASDAVGVPGAVLYLQPAFEIVNLPDFGAAPAPASAPQHEDSARSDSAGGFAFVGVPAGGYSLTVSAPGYRSRMLDVTIAADQTIAIPLATEEAYAVVRGTVRAPLCPGPPGLPCMPQPAAGCTVWVAIAEQAPPLFPLTTTAPVAAPAFRGITGADGAYAIDSVPLAYSGERVVVWTRFDGFESATVDTSVFSGLATIVDVSLQPAVFAEISLDAPRRRAPVQGPVTYAERERLLTVHIDKGQNVSIEAFLLSGRRDGRLSARRFLDPGTYRFSLDSPRLRSGVMIVRVRGEDFADTRRIVLEGK